ncbi:hypothetical protein [Ruminococcus flavefaciens]|uniref:Uncharacterized protein n=1 Tax=Ruminococcus flavefaciens TaxID=1265 RepID=A0A315XT99_RUMFL|nr:hypothetical protein [Ruminococcus flavefaciens]PWJ09967.1 hypothetical protein IE37_03261 [Ruminococcus flavefaciens]SSA52118.1 hypothetical protein SAMN02910325_03261 [Ruminococcus flavefaciens]
MRNSNFKFRNISKSYFAKKSYPITIENNMNSSDSSAEIKKELHLIHVADRKAAQKVGNIVFDGNVSLDGFSSNDMILCIQNEANSILKELKQRDLEVTIDERALNSIISSIFFDKEAVNDRYYQSIKPKKNGDFITKK